MTKLIENYPIRPKDLDGFMASEMDFDITVENAKTPIAMLYQSRYVTIKEFDSYDYTLWFSNEEVRVSFIKGLAPHI